MSMQYFHINIDIRFIWYHIVAGSIQRNAEGWGWYWVAASYSFRLWAGVKIDEGRRGWRGQLERRGRAPATSFRPWGVKWRGTLSIGLLCLTRYAGGTAFLWQAQSGVHRHMALWYLSGERHCLHTASVAATGTDAKIKGALCCMTPAGVVLVLSVSGSHNDANCHW